MRMKSRETFRVHFPWLLRTAQTGCQCTQLHQMKRVRTKNLILNLLYTSVGTKLLIQNCSLDPQIYLVQYKPPKPKSKTSKTWCSLMTVVWMRIVRMTDLHIHPQSKGIANLGLKFKTFQISKKKSRLSSFWNVKY